jgi:hypothetical protein
VNRAAVASGSWLTAAVAGLWLLSAFPAWSLAGLTGVRGLSCAALLCLVPGWLVILLGGSYRVASTPTFMILAATLLRMFFVLVGALIVRFSFPGLRFQEFALWLILFYLLTLFVETIQAVKQISLQK